MQQFYWNVRGISVNTNKNCLQALATHDCLDIFPSTLEHFEEIEFLFFRTCATDVQESPAILLPMKNVVLESQARLHRSRLGGVKNQLSSSGPIETCLVYTALAE